MNILNLPATGNTPAIHFDPEQGIFELTGISIPENATEFYQPVTAWLAQHLPLLKGAQAMDFRLIYFNSASLKSIYLLLKEVKAARANGLAMTVRWYGDPDDDQLTETVDTFTDVLDMPMELILV
ncbi:MAG TPA: DUF1987 domain-containing protein [Flavobacteriales bacterium]|nr:DUF1987 domain-containing protein [Flavobacteriales bacterium]